MQLVYLLIVFAIIIGLLTLKRPLWQAVIGGLFVFAILNRITPLQAGKLTLGVLTTWSSLSVILSFYLITYLQRMLEGRDQLKKAGADLNGLFHNRRVNASLAPVFFGLLPSAGAMILCADIVKEASNGYLTKEEQAWNTNWFRHIPESTLPTYSTVLMLSTLASMPLAPFIAGMIIPDLVLAGIGYFATLRKLPRDPGTPVSTNRKRDFVNLFRHLWSLLLILVLILGFKANIITALFVTLAAAAMVYRFSFKELLTMIPAALETKLLLNTFLVLVLKEFIAYAGVLNVLPDYLGKLPIPAYLVFCLVVFFGCIISGNAGIIALSTPLAFAAIPNGGIRLMILLMCMTHAASQIQPTHVCLVVASEEFQISLGSLIRKTIPYSVLFAILMIGYYNILMLF